MSEFINNSTKRKDKLRTLLLKLHSGSSVDELREDLIGALTDVTYNEVVEV